MKAPDTDLDSQQIHLASSDYDLRITNLSRFIFRKVRHSHPEFSSGSLFDVGAGNGLLIKFFQTKGFKVSGIELSPELVAKMKQDPKLAGVDIKAGDITQLMGDEQFDLVICNDVIEHIEDDQKAITHLWSFVKPGGMLVISVPAHSMLYGKRDKAWGHYRRYDKKNLELKTKNLQHAEIKFITFWNLLGFFVYWFYEKLLKKPINEEMRYSNSLKSRLIRQILELLLRIEESIGGLPLGLTLVVGVKKNIN